MKRRNFLLYSSIGLAGASLLPASAMASRVPIPPLFTKELCPDPILPGLYVAMMNGSVEDNIIFGKLTAKGIKYYDEIVDRSMWFSHPGTYIAINTFIWKYRRAIGWYESAYDALKNRFYQNWALHSGIDLFYRLYVTKKDLSNDVERSLAENIFCAIEPNPHDGIEQATKYLAGDFDTKKALILDLKERYAKLNPRPEQMHDLDISGASGKGPLNDWYRTLSGQTGAFFLTSHYRLMRTGTESNIAHFQQLGDLINDNIEKDIRTRQPSVRGKKGNYYIGKIPGNKYRV